MNPFQYAILPFKRYFEFSGRSSRSELWWFFLLTTLSGFLLQMISVATFDPWSYSSYRFIDVIILLWTLFTFIPQISVQVRRLHDLNRTGLWLLLFYGLYLIGVMILLFGVFLAGMGEFGGFGLMLVLCLVIFIGTPIWQIVWYCLSPVDQDNRFGPNPLLMHGSIPATPVPVVAPTPQAPASSAPASTQDTSSSSVNDRLVGLNKLFEDGLIDEKEFKNKKKKLLDEL
jgi:uncharacterized membrane protein YhaH (DUF805 family)